MRIALSRCLVGIVLLLSFAVSAMAADWVKLGERRVSDRADHDTITVASARGSFDAVKLHVREHAVRFYKVVVHYRNGSKEELELKDVIGAGNETRVIDLKGGQRVIKKIDLFYEAASVGHAGAVVAVWARR